MKLLRIISFMVVGYVLLSPSAFSQQKDLAGFEISIDQDGFADRFRMNEEGDNPYYDNNYTVGLRLGFYGEYANSYYLGLPWVRERIDGFLLDRILYNNDFRETKESHNFVFTTNGFGPTHISDEVAEFDAAVAAGYRLQDDRPFSSFTGFRSTRRLEGGKRFVHSARLVDMGISTSFTFGIGGVGLARGVDNLFDKRRPKANLWELDENKPYPTGQVLKRIFPLFMYSVSADIAVWKPIRKIVLQVRPELNLGYYTNIGLGVDFGKVMNVEGVIDNLSYTDTNNPSLISVNDDNLAFSLVGGVTARAVLYNYHLNGLYGRSFGNYYTFADTRKLIWEAYVGLKIQILQKIEFTYSINKRSSEFKAPVNAQPLWGTLAMKFLIAEAGKGCYD